MKIFDYLFYRVARFYEDRRRMPEPERFGFYVVFIVLGTSLLDVAILVLALLGSQYTEYVKPISILLTVILLPLCSIRYYSKDRLKRVKAIWDREDPSAGRRRRIYLSIYAIVAVVLPFVFTFLKHDLHWM